MKREEYGELTATQTASPHWTGGGGTNGLGVDFVSLAGRYDDNVELNGRLIGKVHILSLLRSSSELVLVLVEDAESLEVVL